MEHDMDASLKQDRWDVFISHASEDKLTVALPIAKELQRAGLSVWLDSHELTLGDSLRAKIDEGLANSRFGAVILSEAFFAKDWPQRELNALVALESTSRKVLLPVLHGINHQRVARYSPILADKLSTSTERGIQRVAMEIASAIQQSQQSQQASSRPHSEPTADHYLLRPTELVGTKVRSYKLGEYIGSGGSGVVFRASHKDLGDELAIKIFYPLSPQYSHFNGLFDRGFRALSRLKHPNLVSARDFGSIELGGVPVSYFVMDFVRGQTLGHWTCTMDGKADAFERRLGVAQQLATAMLAAHETVYLDQVGFEVQGLLHGDLKPANVLVSSGDVPVILDFLLVDVQRLLDPRVVSCLKCYDPNHAFTQGCGTPGFMAPEQTETGAYGTPGFMAPEQTEQGSVTTSTDIYGLGVTLCHLFLPNQASPEIAIKLDSKLPSFLSKLLIEMTAAEPSLRPKNMREVVQRLGSQSQMKGLWKWLTKSFGVNLRR
jgi:serine/threonine protein kinase